MDRYKETFETWDKVAYLYQDKFMGLGLYNSSYDLFCEIVSKKNPQILEIGCGPGNITKYLLNKRQDFKIEAIDVAPNMIKLAKQNNPTANFNTMDCRDIGKLRKKFDAIISGFCIPYLSPEDCIKFIIDCGHLLNNNGSLYLSFVDGVEENSGFKIGSSGDRAYFYYHNYNNIAAALQLKKIEIKHKIVTAFQRDEKDSEEHTIIIAVKK